MSQHKDIELNIVYKSYIALCFIVFSCYEDMNFLEEVKATLWKIVDEMGIR